MSATDARWRFDKGYSELLDTASIELRRKSGPTLTELRATPKDLLKGRKRLDLDFTVEEHLSGTIPSVFSWTLEPGTVVRLSLIPEKGAFLGNFRVPSRHFAVQWKVIPTVAAAMVPEESSSVSAIAGTQMNHSWVEVFPEKEPVPSAVSTAWKNCVNPFDPGQVAKISDKQVLRWNWTGLFRVTALIGWSLEKGWVLGGKGMGFSFSLPFTTGVIMKNQARLSTSGHFYIQVSKKNELLKFSLIREKALEASSSASIGIQFRHSPALKAENSLIDPLLEPAERTLKNCLSRKLRLVIAADALKWYRKKTVVKASWKEPFCEYLAPEYSSLVSGRIPAARKGFSVEGRYDNVEGREFSIKINILNRISGFSKTRSKFDSATVDPAGNLLLEKGVSKTDIRYRWDETEFMRLAFSRAESGARASFNWNWETEGGFTKAELQRILRTILHGRVIPRFLIPGGLKFPLDLKITTSTEFSGEGIKTIKKAPPALQWETLISSLELSYPRRYRKGSFWRDWMEFPEVRHEIVRNPVHCHLSSCYPVRGRTDIQRRQAVDDYKRALRFLEIMDLWQEGRDPVVLMEKNLDFPMFLYFHLLCPPDMKSSALTITGDWEIEMKDEIDASSNAGILMS